MTQTVSVPLWLLILIVLFAAVTFASHFLFPSVRWFFRKRMERVVAQVNARLPRPIEPFKLAERHDMIQRLIYDPEVVAQVVEHARTNNMPEAVAFARARDYAREIVPAFSARVYFSLGLRIARWLSRTLYRVRVGGDAAAQFESLDPDATVIYVVNHRSNMDYILVTWLVSGSTTVSYAVGEWARVWPLSWLIRAMGAYFIRRRARGALYRRVLERYVQMATAGGVTQAFFPEGGLSLDGHQAKAKLGLFSYQVESYCPGMRNVVFVPVAINYDRILEDRFLIAADHSGIRKFRPPILRGLWAMASHLAQRMTLRFRGFGSATVAFGAPLSLAAAAPQGGAGMTQHIADILMARIRDVMPVTPVPLVARALLRIDAPTRAKLVAAVSADLARLQDTGAFLMRRGPTVIVDDALAILFERHIIRESGADLVVRGADTDVLRFYAASIEHHFGEGPAQPVEGVVPENEQQKLLVS
ncbi:glycerol-3-phosphate O-acyltransferase [Ketogulonicigenium robustum]|uniref:Glycerol-3-phosphate acyltransferase n=1 Tax=Ketogulonicigenium robustum TaxID=92947 RepID=A0A1W6NWS9_9RHOB|nr:1-acyl-sn-glycerol-3-phosphate acyltransferase [Ketogulonicigenium robustum]ARO13718.1 glycerol-3-phosphate O-acyltransferase [Ketogulonicigenium robustum]